MTDCARSAPRSPGLTLKITADRGRQAVFVDLFKGSCCGPIMSMRFDSGGGSERLQEVALFLGSHLAIPDAKATIDLTPSRGVENIPSLCKWEMETWDHEEGTTTA